MLLAIVSAWSRQKKLKDRYRDEEVPGIDELAELISGIKHGKVNEYRHTSRARALFAMYYLTGCRASEIVKCLSLRKQKMRMTKEIDEKGIKNVRYELDEGGDPIIDRVVVPHEYLGIMKKHIKFDVIQGKECMLIRTENRKNKQRTTKRQPIPISKEASIVHFVRHYMNMLSPDDILFNFQSKRATQIINQTTNYNIHFIRHIRATHLITLYDFNEQALIKFMGWTDARPAKHYMELAPSDLFMQFYKKQNIK